MNLAQRLRQGAVPHKEAALLVAQIADALHYAHGQNVFHRDIKPGNILLDQSGQPYVTDFGLAVHEDELALEAGRRSGTLPYYSPEQARGEGHRIDGRTDIYSLGVVLYELLSGRHPFEAHSKEQLVDQILHREAKPPRQLRDSIPRELERICLKALSKRITDRYTTAKDMADELRAAVLTLGAGSTAVPLTSAPAPIGLPASTRHDSASTSAESPVLVVPKGLRSFGSEDHDFFLELLPGPRGRDGLPDSIRFWKDRIEQDRASGSRSFTVGLIYGPSGCGKSSLVKAGLLPRLASSVESIYVEASREGTEQQLVRALRRSNAWLKPDIGLCDMIAALRRRDMAERAEGPQKLLIVLDQFEQWLHARGNDSETELLAALRQCDGERVQCILMVRDDFWIAISRFMRNVEVRLLEGDNIALVDLFDPAHARKVLTAFGRALGRLPESPGKLSTDQRKFLDRAVSALAQNGEVIPVRLSLFSEMLKRKNWVPATLRDVGGIEGLGVTFLEETFSSRTANPEHRAHAKAARSVLRVLLPEHGVEIKGHTRPYLELLEASGYAQDRRQFDDLLRVLDTELRLVTPTDSEEVAQNTPASTVASSPQSYQLAHDYLVPSVRDWLTRKQKETRRGRSELLLADRADLWKARHEKKQLPSLWEYVTIRCLTERSRWTLAQRGMMRAAARYYSVRCAAVVGLVILAVVAAREVRGGAAANVLVASLLRAETSDVPQVLHELTPYRRWAIARLNDVQATSERERLHKELALNRLGTAPAQSAARLVELLARTTPEQAQVIGAELKGVFPQIQTEIWQRLQQASTPDEVLSAATVAAACDPDNPRWDGVARAICEQFVVLQPVEAARWIDNLMPIERSLASPLETILTSTGPDDTVDRQHRYVAALGLAKFLRDDHATLAQLLVFHCRQAPEFQSLLAPLIAARGTSLSHVRATQAEDPVNQRAEPQRQPGLSDSDSAGNRIVAELMLGESVTLLDHLQISSDCTVRSTLIHRLSELGVPSATVVSLLEAERRAEVRAALVLALGEYSHQTLPQKLETRIKVQVRQSWQSGNAEEHAAAEWLAVRWNITNQIRAEIEAPLAASEWYTNRTGHSFSIVRNRLDYNFALSATEVTIAQFRRFCSEYDATFQYTLDQFVDRAGRDDCPAIFVTCSDAMRYCNWLSLQEGMSDAQCCYEVTGSDIVVAKADYLRLPGYRLPTLPEWHRACTAGTTTQFNFGNNLRLLPHYAWYFSNSRFDGQHRVQPVGHTKPNTLGLSDTYGNAWEWLTQFENPSWSLINGGSCDNDPVDLQPLGRERFMPPDSREIRVGFRIARTVLE